MILVGHVTKEGSIAGPRVLEHLVDCVLQFEGERERTYRTLRALKNRFGSTSETGVFEMKQGGLVEVLDPSARFVGEATGKPGSVVLAAMEGSRPLLVEVQALVVAVARSCRRAASSPASTATASRSSSPSSPATPTSTSAAPTCSSTSSAACGSTSPAPTSRSRSRSPPPQRGDRARHARQAAGLLRRARPHRRAAHRRPPRAPRRGGREVRPAASPCTPASARTLRHALKAAFATAGEPVAA